MAKPAYSKKGQKSLREAVRIGAILKGQAARVKLVAEAIARVEQGRVESTSPDAVVLKTVPHEALTEALTIISTGGIYDALNRADREDKKRFQVIISLISDACEAYNCSATRVCKTSKQVFAPRGCDPLLQVSRIRLRNGVEGWKGASSSVGYQTPSGPGIIDVSFALIPLDGVKASHNPLKGFRPTKGYPPELQERDYSSPAEKQKIRTAADPRRFRPQLLLGNTQTALAGPPIIDLDGFVLGGNWRTMMTQFHSAKGATAYRDALLAELKCNTCYGLEGAPVEDNILVRVIEGAYDRPRISTLLNVPLSAPVGQDAGAASLSSRLSDQVLDKLARALAKSEATFSDAVSSLGAWLAEKLQVNKVITPSNRSEWLQTDAQGNLVLSSSGVELLQDALIKELLGSSKGLSDKLRQLYAQISPGLLLLARRGVDLVSEIRSIAPELSRDLQSSFGELAKRYLESPDEDAEGVLYGRPIRMAIIVWLRSRMPPSKAAKDVVEMVEKEGIVEIASNEDVLELGGPAGYLRKYIEDSGPKSVRLPRPAPPALPEEEEEEWDEDEDWDAAGEEEEEQERQVPCDVEPTPEGYVRRFFGEASFDDLKGAGFELCWTSECPAMSKQTRAEVGALLVGRSKQFRVLPPKQRVEAAVRALLRCNISVRSSLNEIAVEKAELKREKEALKRELKRKKKDLEEREEKLEDKIEDAEEEVVEDEATEPEIRATPKPEDFHPGEKLLKLPRLGRTAKTRLGEDLGIKTARDLWLEIERDEARILHTRGVSKAAIALWKAALAAQAEEHGWARLLDEPEEVIEDEEREAEDCVESAMGPTTCEKIGEFSVGDSVLVEDDEGRHQEGTIVRLLRKDPEASEDDDEWLTIDRALVETEDAKRLAPLHELLKEEEEEDEEEEDEEDGEELWRDQEDEELDRKDCEENVSQKGMMICDEIGPFSKGDKILADVGGQNYLARILYLFSLKSGKRPQAKIRFSSSARGDESVSIRKLSLL